MRRQGTAKSSEWKLVIPNPLHPQSRNQAQGPPLRILFISAGSLMVASESLVRNPLQCELKLPLHLFFYLLFPNSHPPRYIIYCFSHISWDDQVFCMCVPCLIYTVYYIDRFGDVKLIFHSWDKSHLVRFYNPLFKLFFIFLGLDFSFFFKFLTYIHKEYWFAVLFCCIYFCDVSFWYQGGNGPT